MTTFAQKFRDDVRKRLVHQMRLSDGRKVQGAKLVGLMKELRREDNWRIPRVDHFELMLKDMGFKIEPAAIHHDKEKSRGVYE